MDYITDIQGFQDADHEFLPKEMSIISVQKEVVGLPMISFRDFMLGIQSFDGEVSLRKLHYHLYKIDRKASRNYIRGVKKAWYVESIITRKIINFEDYLSNTSFPELQKQFVCEQVYYFLTFRGYNDKNEYCTIRRSHLLKQWLYSSNRACEKNESLQQSVLESG